MGLVSLAVTPRSTFGKNANRRTRAAGRIPAVVYGQDREAESVELDTHAFSVALLHLAGHTALFSINGDEENIALLREIQRNPVTDMILHVDLLAIPRGVPVTVAVALEVVGECQAVKNGEASVATSLDKIEISVRPRDLPEFIEIDITGMEIHDKIHARDIKLPAGEIVTDPDALVLNIKPSALLVVSTDDEEAEGSDAAAESGEK